MLYTYTTQVFLHLPLLANLFALKLKYNNKNMCFDDLSYIPPCFRSKLIFLIAFSYLIIIHVPINHLMIRIRELHTRYLYIYICNCIQCTIKWQNLNYVIIKITNSRRWRCLKNSRYKSNTFYMTLIRTISYLALEFRHRATWFPTRFSLAWTSFVISSKKRRNGGEGIDQLESKSRRTRANHEAGRVSA